METKTELRKRIAALKTLHGDSEWRNRCAAEAAEMLEAHPAFSRAHTVLLYRALSDELDTRPLLTRWAGRKRLLLPVVIGNDLELRLYTGEASLAVGRWGIEEPQGSPFTDYASIGLAVVPGMAFDRHGNRLGRGRGYYDRLLPRLTAAHKIGYCFPFQLVGEVPAEPFDIRMDEIIAPLTTFPASASTPSAGN